MDNPISTTTRGWVYVGGIIVGAVLGVVAVALSVAGLDQWQPVVTAAATAVALVSSTLARSNLTIQGEDGAEPEPAEDQA